MNFLEEVIHIGLPYIIHALEIMGILIVAWSALKAFWQYIHNAFTDRKADLQIYLAKGMATGLEFKMAAEVLKTVLIQTMDELLVLGAIVLLRGLITLLIHFEFKIGNAHTKNVADSEKATASVLSEASKTEDAVKEKAGESDKSDK